MFSPRPRGAWRLWRISWWDWDDPHSLMVLLLLLPIHFVGTYLSGLRARLMSYRIWHNFNIISAAHASLQACAAILKLFCCSLFSWNAKVLRRNFWELLPLLPYHHHNYLSMANPNALWGTEVVAIRVFVKRGSMEASLVWRVRCVHQREWRSDFSLPLNWE